MSLHPSRIFGCQLRSFRNPAFPAGNCCRSRHARKATRQCHRAARIHGTHAHAAQRCPQNRHHGQKYSGSKQVRNPFGEDGRSPPVNASWLKLLAGAISPILSPRRKAAGRMIFTGLVIFASAKKFSLADQLCRAAQKNLAISPAHHLSAAGRMHFHRRLYIACGNGGHGGRARSRS